LAEHHYTRRSTPRIGHLNVEGSKHVELVVQPAIERIAPRATLTRSSLPIRRVAALSYSRDEKKPAGEKFGRPCRYATGADLETKPALNGSAIQYR